MIQLILIGTRPSFPAWFLGLTCVSVLASTQIAYIPFAQAAKAGVITCKAYGNAWFKADAAGRKGLEVSRKYGMLNGKALTISIDLKRHIVMNRWGDQSARETIIHSKGDAYYIKGRDKTVYYGTYTFSHDYTSAIYSADGAFASFLECQTSGAK